MDAKSHWEKADETKTPDAVSWYSAHLETSLALIERAAATHSASIIDVGGGESTLVDDLFAKADTVCVHHCDIEFSSANNRDIGPNCLCATHPFECYFQWTEKVSAAWNFPQEIRRSCCTTAVRKWKRSGNAKVCS